MAEDKLSQFPESDPRSFGYGVAQSALGMVPVAGPALQQFVAQVIGEPLQRRREDWHREVHAAILRLQQAADGFGIPTLQENQEFLSVVYEATHIAMKTRSEAKRERLINSVLHAAKGVSLDDAVRGRFMACIDRFSDNHVLALRVLDNPRDFPACVERCRSMSMGARLNVLRAVSPDTEDDAFEEICSDLLQERFIEGGFKTTISGDGLLQSSTTKVGQAFLRFISSPLNGGQL